MVTFLFWNVGRRPLDPTIVELARSYQIDVFIFAECITPPPDS